MLTLLANYATAEVIAGLSISTNLLLLVLLVLLLFSAGRCAGLT
jgi:hypothetical protein